MPTKLGFGSCSDQILLEPKPVLAYGQCSSIRSRRFPVRSNKGRASVPIKNLEACEKKAKLIAIDSHADLFSSAAYLCLQQESMSVTALSRLLEAVAKSIKHSTAMSTIFTTQIFQARCAAALASPKLHLDNSSYD